MCCVYDWQLLKSSSDNSTIRVEYSLPLSDASTDEHEREVMEAHSGYVAELLEIQKENK